MSAMKKPIILLDKSVLQSLSREEAEKLSSHFFVNLPPVLIVEILADLRKEDGQKIVSGLFSKLLAMNPISCIDWRFLCAKSLLGKEPPFGQVPTDTELSLWDDHLDYGTNPPPIIEAIKQWSSGQISTEVLRSALAWKEEADSYTEFESFKSGALSSLSQWKNPLRFDSAESVRGFVELFMSDADVDQESLLQLILTELAEYQDCETKVMSRWHNEGQLALKEFAPYAYYCLRTFVVLWFAVRDEIVTTKRTNRIDLEYFFYAPFADWFSSNDRFHKALYMGILDPEHTFCEGSVLKGELQQDKLTRTLMFNVQVPHFFS